MPSSSSRATSPAQAGKQAQAVGGNSASEAGWRETRVAFAGVGLTAGMGVGCMVGAVFADAIGMLVGMGACSGVGLIAGAMAGSGMMNAEIRASAAAAAAPRRHKKSPASPLDCSTCQYKPARDTSDARPVEEETAA